jgi:glutamyl-tRNA synthetase
MAVSERYIGRLAPSPTGLLHLGHARTFWIAYERARAAQGKLWLRDEDLDAQRAREEFSVAMKDDLRWLGISWDVEMRQSERVEFYRDAMQRLIRDGSVYPCSCSRRDLQEAVTAPHEEDDEPVYNGRCRKSLIGDALADGKNYRFRVPDDEVVSFHDENAGWQTFVAGKDFGDFLVWRKDDLPSYQLACVVDDEAMQITEVVRGRDLLKSTARQILLQRALGFAMPKYYHCELLRDANGVRLAKRHDALSLRALRQAGMTPEQVRAMF